MITIQTLQGTGVIRIESNPPNAEVYLDGEYYGKSPVTIKDVEMGLHIYTIKCPGQPDFSSSVNVVAGELCFSKYDFTNYGLEENCPPIDLSGGARIGNTGTGNTGIESAGKMGIHSLQAPEPIPGYIIISQGTIMWVLVGALVTMLLYDYIKKRT